MLTKFSLEKISTYSSLSTAEQIEQALIIFSSITSLSLFKYKLDMTANQKHLNISITKIFNWPESSHESSFDLIFYSQFENLPIINKSVIGTFVANSMILNAYLKITYTSEESKIILKVFEQGKEEELGVFQIDLEELTNKNVLYYPFGTENVLQVNKYEGKSIDSRTGLDRMAETANPISSPSQYSRSNKLTSNSLHINSNYGNHRNEFQQRVAGLLEEIRQLRLQNKLVLRLSGYEGVSNGHNKRSLEPSKSTGRLNKYGQKNWKQGGCRKLVLNSLHIIGPDGFESNEKQ